VRAPRPVGDVTRGTTAPNRLRRVDRYLAGPLAGALRRAADPLVVDLGFGASPVTTVELATRLSAVRSDVEVVGVEIDPVRVRAAQSEARPGLAFVHGGFELPPDGRRPVLVRALNVLRQYPEDEAAGHWSRLAGRLAPGGYLVEGTSSESGRRACWVTLGPGGPLTLTLATRLADLQRPSELAERLPKALIHRNVDGERIHALLCALDAAWAAQAVVAPFGVRQRWLAAVATVRDTGWPVLHGPTRWRLGEVTVPWSAVAPAPLTGDRRGRR
jgi:hypothetical protein